MTQSSGADHPQRRAAAAAHSIREALDSLGLLARVPECRGFVDESGQPAVSLGTVDATTALLIAAQLRRRRRRTSDTAASGRLVAAVEAADE